MKTKKCKLCNYIGPLEEFMEGRRICEKCRKEFYHADYSKRSQKKPIYYARKVRERNGII